MPVDDTWTAEEALGFLDALDEELQPTPVKLVQSGRTPPDGSDADGLAFCVEALSLGPTPSLKQPTSSSPLLPLQASPLRESGPAPTDANARRNSAPLPPPMVDDAAAPVQPQRASLGGAIPLTTADAAAIAAQRAAAASAALSASSVAAKPTPLHDLRTRLREEMAAAPLRSQLILQGQRAPLQRLSQQAAVSSAANVNANRAAGLAAKPALAAPGLSLAPVPLLSDSEAGETLIAVVFDTSALMEGTILLDEFDRISACPPGVRVAFVIPHAATRELHKLKENRDENRAYQARRAAKALLRLRQERPQARRLPSTPRSTERTQC